MKDSTLDAVLLLCVLVLATVGGHVEGSEEDSGGESVVFVVNSRLSENTLVSRLGTVAQDAAGHVCDRLFDLGNISRQDTSVGINDVVNKLIDIHLGLVLSCLFDLLYSETRESGDFDDILLEVVGSFTEARSRVEFGLDKSSAYLSCC